MSGYIYTMYAGADPGHGWVLNDPVLGTVPTLGACVPNIRRVVKQGDHIFVVSGRVQGERQFVVGGFKVAEKIDALAAYHRFPDRRLRRMPDGSIQGNIIVQPDGSQSPLDGHPNFAARVENYIVGTDPVCLESWNEYNRARSETVGFLADLFDKEGQRVFDIIGRYRKMDENQVKQMLAWLRSIKQ